MLVVLLSTIAGVHVSVNLNLVIFSTGNMPDYTLEYGLMLVWRLLLL